MTFSKSTASIEEDDGDLLRWNDRSKIFLLSNNEIMVE